MIIVDSALKRREEENNPIRVGMCGAGAMARGVALQIIRSTPGMELSAIANRTVTNGLRAFAEAGVEDAVVCENAEHFEKALFDRNPAVVADPELLASSENIDVVLEVTGTIDFALKTVLTAIAHSKPVVLMNAELDGTVGPILKRRADANNTIITACDGDQPGVEMNLFRFVKGLGMEPLVCGSMKGMLDHYRTPETQAAFAAEWDQGVEMVTSFADGTKVSFEQAIVANGTGMKAPKRGLYAYEHRDHIDTMTSRYDLDEIKELGGIVDFAIGATPGPGVYVFATQENSLHLPYLDLYKLGKGPLYSFYTPYHLCYFEVPTSIARVALFDDVVLAPMGKPYVDVVATAKKDLVPGERLDGVGGFTCYGQCESAEITYRDRLLPMGVSHDCIVKRHISKDSVLTYSDVDIPEGRLIDELRAEQDSAFGSQLSA
ncbi:MAG: NAD(P)-dependent oxidoreductase [Pseudomonadota bacterium]